MIIWLWADEGASSLVEYILLAVLIGVAAITGMSFLGKSASNRLTNLANALDTPAAGGTSGP